LRARNGGRRGGDTTCPEGRAVYDRRLRRTTRGPADPMLHQRGAHPAGDKDARGNGVSVTIGPPLPPDDPR